MANVDPALGQKIFDVAQRQRVFHVHHHDQTDHFWRAVEISERVAHGPKLPQPKTARKIALTTPFKPYYRLSDVAHAYCNAHHLRELKALIELDEEPWAEKMRDLLVEANDAVGQAREEGATALPPATITGFVDRYWEAIRLGLTDPEIIRPMRTIYIGQKPLPD